MNQKSVAIILSALAVVIVLFAACGKKDQPTDPEPVTLTDANGEVYEQVTEIVSEVETVTGADGAPEIRTEVVTEIVTDAKGEKVTKKDGTPEVVTEVVSEVVTEIVTRIETVTVPYSEPDTTQKGDTTAAAPETTDPELEDFNTDLLGGGTPVEVVTNKDGKPANSKIKAIFDKAKKSKQLMIKLYVSSQDMSDMGTMAYTFYTKDDKIAIDMSIPSVAGLGALGSLGTMRAIINGNQATINFGKAYHYTTTLDDAESMGMGTEIFDAIAAEGMDYQGTARVKDGGKTYDCETYTDGSTTNKYYFDTNGKLVRVEIISNDGTSTVMKVVDYSYKVSDKEFEPAGKAISEEDMEKLFGSLT